MRSLKILLLVLLVSSCNSAKITYDYDREIDFSDYKTFAVYPELKSGLNPFDEDRLLSSIKSELREKGIWISETPDFYMNAFTEQYREPNRNTLGIGIGGGGNVGVGVSGGFPMGGPQMYLRIIIDFVDVETDSLIWQAVIESKFNQNASPEAQQAQFDKIIARAFKKYPPKK